MLGKPPCGPRFAAKTSDWFGSKAFGSTMSIVFVDPPQILLVKGAAGCAPDGFCNSFKALNTLSGSVSVILNSEMSAVSEVLVISMIGLLLAVLTTADRSNSAG